MKEFKEGDSFIYFPGNKVCLLEIVKIGEYDEQKKYKPMEYKRYTYADNGYTYDSNDFQTGKAKIFLDLEKETEYAQIDHGVTNKYCICHIIYCG